MRPFRAVWILFLDHIWRWCVFVIFRWSELEPSQWGLLVCSSLYWSTKPASPKRLPPEAKRAQSVEKISFLSFIILKTKIYCYWLINYHLGPILSRLTSHFWIASIFHSFTLTKVLPASIPACRWDRKFSKNENILTLSQKCLNMENASPFLPDWTWPPYSRRAQPCPQVPPCTSSSRMMILA